MSEPMALEIIAARNLDFDGYLTQLRVPFKYDNRGNPHDLDVLGIKIGRRNNIIIVECKSWYPDSMNITTIKKLLKKLNKDKGEFLNSSQASLLGIKSVNELLLIVPTLTKKCELELPSLLRELSNTYAAKVSVKKVGDVILEVIKKIINDRSQRGRRYTDSALELINMLIRCHKNKTLEFNSIIELLNQ